MKYQNGFSSIIVLVALVATAVIGFAGWRVYDNNNQARNTSMTNAVVTTPQAQNSSIETAADVAAAEQELGTLNIDAELDTTALEADIQQLQ